MRGWVGSMENTPLHHLMFFRPKAPHTPPPHILLHAPPTLSLPRATSDLAENKLKTQRRKGETICKLLGSYCQQPHLKLMLKPSKATPHSQE